MIAYHIHIEGQVQGVGFRPYVWRMAHELGLTGWVSNDVDGVHIEVSGKEKQCGKFCYAVVHYAPSNAIVLRNSMHEIKPGGWKEFLIRESAAEGVTNLLITPDLALCESCRKEILTPRSRRYHYAFTTCTRCGPRYSIIRELPYDRNTTTMHEFSECDACDSEYNDPVDRRYFSQTNSCPDCEITLALMDSKRRRISISTEEILERTSALLADGKIVAIKGIGGYLLLCDAANAHAIQMLRSRKHRPAKPFALLYPSLEAVRQDAFVSDAEAEALCSTISPIVILKAKKKVGVALNEVSPHIDHLGVMLPYSPLLELIMHAWSGPLVATSANESGSPIYFQDDTALQQLQGIADYFITNNRDIVVPQDDSVVKFTSDDQQIILRRSRGMAPTFLPHPLIQEPGTWLAMGSDMKSAFALLHQGNTYISQFLGDLGNFQTQESFEYTLEHWKKLLHAHPKYVLLDKHPVYFSSMLGKRLSRQWGVPVIEVQHHQAHFGAVLAENDLLGTKDPVLGVVWDGTGWGEDGNVWGGEFFTYDGRRMKRVAHLNYFDHYLGDKVSKEPRLCALSLCKDITNAHDLIRSKFSATEWNVYTKILSQSGLLQTSSIGRLFDGVASLLGLCDKSTYEGEAALYLETLASQASEKELLRVTHVDEDTFSLKRLMIRITDQIRSGMPKENIAFSFHLTLVGWITEVAARQNSKRLAFSGGVFQNALLVHLIKANLGESHQLYFHRQLSPNDECIGLGQLTCHYIQTHRDNLRHVEHPAELSYSTN